MTQRNARTFANVVLAAAGAGVAYLVVTRPRLRRLAVGALRNWLTDDLPVTVVQAWMESAPRRLP